MLYLFGLHIFITGMSTKYANLLRSNKIMNRTIDQISKQLKLCVKKSRDLTNRNSIMRKKSRNTKLQMMKMKQDGKKLVKMFKSNSCFFASLTKSKK